MPTECYHVRMKITEHFNHGDQVQYRVGRYDASLSHPRFGPVRIGELYIQGDLIALPELEFRNSEAIDNDNRFDVNVEDYYLEIYK